MCSHRLRISFNFLLLVRFVSVDITLWSHRPQGRELSPDYHSKSHYNAWRLTPGISGPPNGIAHNHKNVASWAPPQRIIRHAWSSLYFLSIGRVAAFGQAQVVLESNSCRHLDGLSLLSGCSKRPSFSR